MELITRARALLSVALTGALLGGFALPVAAQQATGTIRGRVVENATQRPLSGVQVSVPGSGRGALSNVSGEFIIINVPAGSHRVKADMIGYTSVEQDVTVAGGEVTRADFRLAQSAISLDAVVVTGTPGGTQQRALGNAVASIDAARITEVAPISTVTQLLQGRTPGLTVMQGSGTAGTASNFRIRGTSSLNAGNHPVVIVDGVRIQSSTQGGFSVSGQSTSALNAINPDDIETIEVIKGPAAATLYGAEAASGVIQIITKKGRAGQQGVTWNAKVELGNSEWHLDMPVNYTTCTEARINARNAQGQPTWPGCAGMSPTAPIEQRILSEQPLRNPGVLRNGQLRNYTLSASGGGDRYSFYVSGDHDAETGIFINNHFNRWSGRGSFSFTPTDELDFQVTSQYSRTHTQLPLNDNASNGWLRNAYRGLPGWNAPWESGWLGMGPQVMSQYNNQERAERFIFGVTSNYAPTSWLRNRITVGMDAGQRLHTLFYEIDRTGRSPWGATNANGYISDYVPQTRNYTVDYSGTASFDLRPDLTSALSFGTQYRRYRFESTQAIGQGILADPIRHIGGSNVETRAVTSTSEENSLGFYVQEQLGWQNRLFLTGAVRVDDHSAFGDEFSLMVYPKVMASWVVSEEPFFNSALVDHLKLRAAWGQAGNAPAPFNADRTYAAQTTIMQDQRPVSALRADSYGNPEIHAERGDEIEFGFDASLFEGRMGAEITYFLQNTYDALMTTPVAPSSGFGGSVQRNVGHIRNRGVEISFFGTPIQTRQLSWDTRVAFSTAANELISFGGAREEFIPVGYRSSQRHDEGYPLAGYWAEEILRNADGSLRRDAAGRPMLGDFYFVGPSAPTREAAFSNTIRLPGNLSLYGFMDYKGGHYLLNMTAGTRAADGNSWTVNDPNADPEIADIARWGGNAPFIERADFVKLRELSVSYALPTNIAQRFGSDGISLSLAGRNLAVWSKYSGPDPEVNINGADTFTRGDSNSVPMLRQFMLTLNTRF